MTWSIDQPDGITFELLQLGCPSEKQDGFTRYKGPDQKTVITGLTEGVYEFKVRAIDSEGNAGSWSDPLVLHVEYMGRSQLFFLLVTGAFVAISTIAAIIHGFLKNR